MRSKLITRKDDWGEGFTHEDYVLIKTGPDNKLCGINFLCPGCNSLIGVRTPPWTIDFEKLTARASILHTKEYGGCGWHGYLTDGELVPC